MRPKPAPAPSFEKRTKWAELPAPYKGWYVNLWLNHPAEFADAAESFDVDVKIGALGRIFMEHNDWPDPTAPGEVLPATSDPEFWKRLPDEVLGIMIALLQAEKERVPNSIRQNSRR
jgi:hypothetical protein